VLREFSLQYHPLIILQFIAAGVYWVVKFQGGSNTGFIIYSPDWVEIF